MATIHWFLGSKGGIGKSFCANGLAQYYQSKISQPANGKDKKAGELMCFDLDPSCQSLSRTNSLKAKRVDVLTEQEIDKTKFDPVIETLCNLNEKDIAILDTGSNTYISMFRYFTSLDTFTVLLENSKNEVFINIPIPGGPDFTLGLGCFTELAEIAPDGVHLVPWLNPYLGALEFGGKSFEDSPTYEKCKSQIYGIVKLPKWDFRDMAKSLTLMFDRNLTFAEASDKTLNPLGIMPGHRIKIAQQTLFAAITGAGL